MQRLICLKNGGYNKISINIKNRAIAVESRNINISSTTNVCFYCIFSRPVCYVLCVYTLCQPSLHFALMLCAIFCPRCCILCSHYIRAEIHHTWLPLLTLPLCCINTPRHCTFFLLACACVCLCAYFLRFLFVFKLKIQNFKLFIFISLARTLVLCIMLAQEIAPTEIGKHANIIRGKLK